MMNDRCARSRGFLAYVDTPDELQPAAYERVLSINEEHMAHAILELNWRNRSAINVKNAVGSEGPADLQTTTTHVSSRGECANMRFRNPDYQPEQVMLWSQACPHRRYTREQTD
jgi:hypothetical protein